MFAVIAVSVEFGRNFALHASRPNQQSVFTYFESMSLNMQQSGVHNPCKDQTYSKDAFNFLFFVEGELDSDFHHVRDLLVL